MQEPDPYLLRQVLNMLECALTPDSNLQKQANEFLEKNSSNPQFVLYLAHVFVRLKEAPANVRHIAGLTLKTIIDRGYLSLVDGVRNSLRQEILDGLVEERSEIRRAAANCITAIVRIASLSTWSNLPGLIASALSSSNLMAQNGALEAIVMLAEDTNDQWIYPFDAPSAGPGSSMQSAPLTLVMQPLFQLMVSSEPRTKLLAATAMLHFADGDLGKAAFHKYLEVLSILTNDASTQMKCVVIKSLACIVRGAWDVAQPSMNSILSFVVEGVRDRDDDTAKAACEFFDVFSTSAISQDEVDAQMRERAGEKVPWQGLNQALLKPHLPLLVQLLVSRMQMTEEDLALMSYSNDLGDVADRPEDVRPHIRSGASNAVPKVDGETKGINDDDDEDEDDDGDDAHGEVKTFTVRQAAARALEMLSQCLNTEVALVVIPELQRLFSIGNDKSRWVERELAVLVLGTISDGCVDDLANDLRMLLDLLLSLLKDPYPSVRSISAWAIGRYAKWISDCNAEAVEDNNAQGLILRVCVESLSAALNDSNRGVQQSTCSALYCFASQASSELSPFADIILFSAMQSLSRYQVRSRISIYDMISHCAGEAVFDEVLGSGDAVSKSRCDAILKELVPRFLLMDPGDPELCPLFECLSYLARPMNAHFGVACREIFPKSFELISLDLNMALSFAVTNPGQTPDLQRAEIGLDMMESMLSLGPAVVDLLETPVGAGLIDLVSRCVSLPYSEIRCSGFALIGTLCEVAPWAKIAPHCEKIVNACVDSIHLYSISSPTVRLNTCNNAVWALGKLAINIGVHLTPLIVSITERFVRLLIRREGVNSTLCQNIAVTLGVLSEHCSAAAVITTIGKAPFRPDADWSVWSENWLNACKACTDPAERRQALIGFCHAVSVAPNSLIRLLPFIAATFASAFDRPNEKNTRVLMAMATILINYKAVMGAQWTELFDQWPEQVRDNLSQRLGVNRL